MATITLDSMAEPMPLATGGGQNGRWALKLGTPRPDGQCALVIEISLDNGRTARTALSSATVDALIAQAATDEATTNIRLFEPEGLHNRHMIKMGGPSAKGTSLRIARSRTTVLSLIKRHEDDIVLAMTEGETDAFVAALDTAKDTVATAVLEAAHKQKSLRPTFAIRDNLVMVTVAGLQEPKKTLGITLEHGKRLAALMQKGQGRLDSGNSAETTEPAFVVNPHDDDQTFFAMVEDIGNGKILYHRMLCANARLSQSLKSLTALLAGQDKSSRDTGERRQGDKAARQAR